jgi:hypothetical protein
MGRAPKYSADARGTSVSFDALLVLAVVQNVLSVGLLLTLIIRGKKMRGKGDSTSLNIKVSAIP